MVKKTRKAARVAGLPGCHGLGDDRLSDGPPGRRCTAGPSLRLAVPRRAASVTRLHHIMAGPVPVLRLGSPDRRARV